MKRQDILRGLRRVIDEKNWEYDLTDETNDVSDIHIIMGNHEYWTEEMSNRELLEMFMEVVLW